MKTWQLALITFTATILVAGAVVGAVFAFLVHNENIAQGTISYDAVEEPRKKEEPKSKYEVGPPDATEILELVNNERAKVGVAPLVINQKLVQSAEWKANDMVVNNYYGHKGPDGRQGYEHAFDIAGSTCSYISENIHQQPLIDKTTSQSVFDGWMNSESHRNALLDAKYTSTGVATAKSEKRYAYFAVQHFCQP